MTNRTLLIAHSAIYALFAAALFFFPYDLWPYYGLEVNDEYARFLSQHNSIFLGGLAILSFLFLDASEDPQIASRLFQGLMWTNLLGVVITLYACISGIFTGIGWSDPVFFTFLAVLCYLQLSKIA